MQRIRLLIPVFFVLLLTLACGGSLWPPAGANDGPYDPIQLMRDAAMQQVSDEHDALQTFNVLDVRQVVPDASQEFIVFFSFTTVATDAAPAREGWGYAIGAHRGAQQFNVVQHKSVVSETPPPFVGYDTDTFNNMLIVFGRTFSPDVHAVRLSLQNLQPRTAAPTPQGGIGVLLGGGDDDAAALLIMEVLDANEQVLARYEGAQRSEP